MKLRMTVDERELWRATYAAYFAEMFEDVKTRRNGERPTLVQIAKVCAEDAALAADLSVLGLRHLRKDERDASTGPGWEMEIEING